MALVMIMNFKGKTVAWPPYVVVRPGQDIVFKCVNTAATVFLPKPEIFSGGPALAAPSEAVAVTLSVTGSHGAAKVTIKGQTLAGPGGKFTYAAGSAAPGVYPYSVYCKNPNDFAEGNSSPVIIIEPPEDGIWPDFCMHSLSQTVEGKVLPDLEAK